MLNRQTRDKARKKGIAQGDTGWRIGEQDGRFVQPGAQQETGCRRQSRFKKIFDFHATPAKNTENSLNLKFKKFSILNQLSLNSL
ncbi:MAG: hypothetical protein KDJ80_05145 [Nitratireductor sp.]|nr:hypothetical protein [Nitratireductor sp.]